MWRTIQDGPEPVKLGVERPMPIRDPGRTPPAANAAETLALIALAHVASDEELLPRFLALSGLDLDDLRARAQDPAMLGAVLDFLLAHEPDLIRFAELQEIAPATIAKARRALPGAAVDE